VYFDDLENIDIQQIRWGLSTFSRFMAAEGIQYFISWRAYNINDLPANLVGVVAGCVVFPADFRRKKSRFSQIND
jgi:glycopeptide antibiotics resistance protein